MSLKQLFILHLPRRIVRIEIAGKFPSLSIQLNLLTPIGNNLNENGKYDPHKN